MSFDVLLKIILVVCVSYLTLSVFVRFGFISSVRFRVLARLLTRRLKAKANHKIYPVKYVSERNHKLLRWIPWDASGVLSTTEKGFHFEGSSPLGRRLEMDFNPNESTVNYQKGSLLWDGGLPWCVIEVNGEKHYFTSEVNDDSIVADEAHGVGTTQIYQALANRYIKLN